MTRFHDDPDLNQMPLVEHLLELRNRLMVSVIAFAICLGLSWFAAPQILQFLLRPLAEALGSEVPRVYATSLTEPFFVYMQIAIFTAAFVSFPIVANQVWKFVAPGLYKNERRAFLPYLIASPILFFMGAALVYYLIFPLAWAFFLSFAVAPGADVTAIEFLPRIQDYLTLTMQLIFAFGLAFQLPVALTLMARVGLLSSEALVRTRKFAIVGIFVVAAALTPPDVISQIGLAVPLLLLFELSIQSVRMIERARLVDEKAAAEAEAASAEAPPAP